MSPLLPRFAVLRSKSTLLSCIAGIRLTLSRALQSYSLYRTRLPLPIVHQALFLLGKLKQRYPTARGSATSAHRLFLSSLMLSSKISMDDTYSNKSWQVVGQGLFELREVNQMERELFAFLGWNVVVRDEELAAWVDEVVGEYNTMQEALVAPAVATRSNEERKRRRNNSSASPSLASPSSSSSSLRSASPEERVTRHRRAADAALALLHGAASPETTRSSRRSRPRTPLSQPSDCSSDCSSLSSPLSGSTTPGSPGPQTPLDGSPGTTASTSSWIKGQSAAGSTTVAIAGVNDIIPSW